MNGREKRQQQLAFYERLDSLNQHTTSYLSRSKDVREKVDRLLIDKLIESKANVTWKPRKHKSFKPRRPVPVKKILLPLISLALVFVVIASMLPVFYGTDDFDINVSIEPADPVEGDLIFINATIPTQYNITQVWANISGIDTINLSLIDNTTAHHFWQGTWLFHNLSAGDHLINISAIDYNQMLYYTLYRWTIIENATQNESIDDQDIKDNATQNRTTTNDTLSLDLWTDKQQYTVNEIIALHGLIYYNETLVNASVNLSVFGPNLTASLAINASNGTFNYNILAELPGEYVFEVNVNVGNDTIQEILKVTVTSGAAQQLITPPGNFTARGLNTTIIHLSWSNGTGSDTTYVVRNTEGYPEHTTDGVVCYNGTATAYNDTNLTFNTSYYYVAWGYNRSTSLWSATSSFASASTFVNTTENITIIPVNESIISITDSREEELYIVPGTRFSVERTVDGPHGTEVIFVPLFSDALTLDYIEILEDNKTTEQQKKIDSTATHLYTAGKATSSTERRIDNLRQTLPSHIRELDQVAYSTSFELHSPRTVRIWFTAPSFEDMQSGNKPSSGHISYLVFTNDDNMSNTSYDYEGSTWWSSSWGYRKLITVNHSQVDADLTNFPILVYESSDSDLASKAQDDGDDIAFVLWSDNTTKLNHEIELFNGTSGKLTAWVNITSLSSSVDTKIWMYYNNSACSSQENVNDTWNGDYILVMHMNETSGNRLDSTSYDHVAVNYGAAYSNGGKIGGCAEFDGDADKMIISNVNGGGNHTVEFWFKNPSSSSNDEFEYIYSHNAYGTNPARHLYFNSSNGRLKLHQTNVTGGGAAWYTATNYSDNQWHYCHMRAPIGSDTKFGVDKGVEATHIKGDTDVNASLFYGARNNNASNRYFGGFLDEIRLSIICRSLEWINTSYNTMNSPSTFLSFGSQEDGVKPSISFDTPPTPANNSQRAQNWVQVNVTVSDPSNTSSFIDWDNSLVGYWSFEHTNSTHVFDTSIYDNNVSFEGTGFDDNDIEDGVYGDALHFDDANTQYLNIPDNNNLSFINGSGDVPFSISTWVYLDDTTDRQRFVGKADAINDGEYLLTTTGANIFAFILFDQSASAYIARTYSVVPTLGVWYHLVGTYNGNGTKEGIKLYLNGSRVDDGDLTANVYTSMEDTDKPLKIGRYGTTYLDGLVDEVQVWNRTLSWEEINASYNSSDYKLYHNFTGLSDGNYSYYAHAIDTAGNENTTEIRTLTIDTTKPNISFVSPTPPNNNQTTNTYAYINVSVTDPSNTSSFIDWDNSLVGYWSFEHTNSTHVFDNSTYGNNGTRKYANITGDADVADSNETQCVDYDTLQSADDVYNGWTFMATSGLASGNTTIITDYDYVNSSYRALYFQDALTGFNEGDLYALWYNTEGPNLTTGKFGSAFSFDRGDYVDCGNDASLDITDEITIEAWVKYGAMIGYPRLVSKSRISGYALRIKWDGEIQLAAEFGGVAQDNFSWSSSGFNQGDWGHVVATYNGSTIKYYINGADAGNATPFTPGPLGTNSLPLCIGAESPGTAFLFNGSIDEVRVWNRVLSWEEINASYNSTVNQLYHNFTGLNEGNYTYYAHAIDTAGNENTTETRNFKVIGDPPEIEFVPPTPWDNNQTTDTYAYVNVSVTDPSDTSSFIDWDDILVGYWSFEHTNSTHVFDNSTYGNHGTFNGSNFGESNITNGKYGDALEFDGSGEYIDLPKDGMTAGRSEVTLEFWINADEWVSTNTIWDEYYSNIYWQNSIRCDYWRTRDSSTGPTGGRNNDLALPTLSTGGWHHLVFVYSVSQNIKAIYLDGEFYASTSNSIDILTSERQGACIGYACDGNNFDGTIDEVRVWNRVLSWEEINASYNSKVNSLYHNFTGLNERNHTYYAHAIDTGGNENTTETRHFEVLGDLPEIGFVLPTPDNNTVTSNTYAYINISVNDSSDTSSFIDWNNSLVGYWNFDHTNSTGVYDNSTYDNFGAFNGGNFGESNITIGKYGNALEFDGNNDYVDCGNDSSLNFGSDVDFSLDFWIKFKAYPGIYKDFIGTFGGGTTLGYEIGFVTSDNRLRFLIKDTDGNDSASSTTFAPGLNKWYHFVLTADRDGDATLYANGEESCSATMAGVGDIGNNVFKINNVNGDYTECLFDEVRLYNRVLSPEEINASYNSKVNQLYHNFTGLSEGNYTYYAHSIDTGGNENTTETRNLTVDTTKPNISFVPPTPPNNNQTTDTHAYINVSTTDTNNISSFIDWDNSLVGYWNFEYINSTYVFDNSTYNNHGTFNGANFGESNTTTGKYGNALEFDGGDDYVNCGNSGSLDITEEVTIDAWVKLDSLTSRPSIAGRSGYWLFLSTAGRIYMYLNTNEGWHSAGLSDEYTWTDGWHHVVGTYNYNTEIVKYYRDGDCVKTITSGTTGKVSSGGNLIIGVENSNYFDGSIDEVCIYNRALSPEEINASYNSKVNQLYHNFTGLQEGNHTYYAHAIDAAGNENATETRYFKVLGDPPEIEFVPPTPDNNTVTSNTYAYINVSVNDASDTSSFIDWNNSLVGYWNFEHTNSTGVYDNSTYNNFGTFNGANFGESNITIGKYGDALDFDGSNDYVEATSNDLDIAGDLTVEIWAYPEDYEPVMGIDRRVLINRIDGNNAYQITCWGGGGFIFAVNDGGTQYRNDSRGYVTDTWYHLLGTYDATSHEIILYVNGISNSDGSSTPRGLGNGGNLQIGRRDDDGYFKGAIDEVRIWNRILSWEEINASYDSKVNQLCHNVTGLSEGNYTYYAHAIDIAGNENTTETRNLTIDTTKPNISFVPPTPWDNNQTTNTYAYINVSTTDTNNISSFIDWNNSLVGYWNFEHINSTHVFDNSSYGNNGVIKHDNITSTADNVDTNGTQCVDNDSLAVGGDDFYNGWNFEVTSGAAVGNTTIITDYDYVSEFYRVLYFQDDIGDFQQGDSYNLWYDVTGPSNTNGKFGSGLNLDGANDYIEIPDSGDLNWEKITIETWFYAHNASIGQYIVSKFQNFANKDYSLGIDNNQVVIWYENGGGDYLNHIGSISDNTWHHVAVVYTGWDSYEVYIDGNVSGSDSGTSPSRSNTITNLSIGYAGPIYNNYYFNGTIDEVHIWNRTLSWEEINASYNSKVNQLYHNFTGLSPANYSYYAHAIDTAGNENTTETRHFEVLAENTSINVTPPQWNIGTIDIGDTNETTGFYFNLTNEGNVALDITINATNATNSTGAKWNLTTTPGHDNFSLQYNLSGAGTWTSISTSFTSFVTDLAIDGYQMFDLKLLMATTSSTVDPMEITVTFKSVAS